MKDPSHRKKRAVFKSSDGVSLEGEILEPDRAPVATVILAHPHPLYGGNMRNNVIDTLWRTLPEDGFLTFRFNFRGVGSSEGNFGEGIGETHDLNGAIRFLTDADHTHSPCFLVGYSFGAYVTYLLDFLPPNVKGITMISPPVSMMAFDAGQFKDFPTLFIAGDRDLFCRPDDLKRLIAPLNMDKGLRLIPGIDHFWFGKEKILHETIRSWLLSRLNGDA